MKWVSLHRVSPSMGIALAALVIALGGTAVAASTLVNGDKLIKNGTLSGNRLRKHTITGTQVNLSKLGKVPSATSADKATNASHATSADTATNASHATSADTATNASHATSADAATNATSATNSANLGGMPPAAYQGAIRWALVDQAGAAVIAQSGGISVASHPFTGETQLDFGTTTTGHAVWAVQSARDNLATNGAATAAPCGTGSDVYPNCGNATWVDVETHDASGALANRSFYVFLLP